MSNNIIITDAGDEQSGTSITAPLGLRNKRTIQASLKPSFDDWARYIKKQTRI